METISLLVSAVVVLVIIAIGISRYNGSSKKAKTFLATSMVALFAGFVVGLGLKAISEKSDSTTETVVNSSPISKVTESIVNLLSMAKDNKVSVETPVCTITRDYLFQTTFVPSVIMEFFAIDDS